MAVSILLLVVVFALGSYVWRSCRAGDMLDQWASSKGYRIIDREWRTMRTGPYFFRKGKGQEVYHVTVEDAQGRRRSGYVRLGGWFLGMMSDATDVTWDDER